MLLLTHSYETLKLLIVLQLLLVEIHCLAVTTAENTVTVLQPASVII